MMSERFGGGVLFFAGCTTISTLRSKAQGFLPSLVLPLESRTIVILGRITLRERERETCILDRMWDAVFKVFGVSLGTLSNRYKGIREVTGCAQRFELKSVPCLYCLESNTKGKETEASTECGISRK